MAISNPSTSEASTDSIPVPSRTTSCVSFERCPAGSTPWKYNPDMAPANTQAATVKAVAMGFMRRHPAEHCRLHKLHHVCGMDDLIGFPARAFTKADTAPDTRFYAQPRFVAHIDDGAIAAVTRLYRDTLPPGGAILDLMSSWISHLPPEMAFEHVTGHGMNAEELAANPRLDSWFVQDLNADPILQLPSASLDAACICVSVQYLQQPVAVFRELARVLHPGAPLIITFSNRCFPTKAVAIWQALDGAGQQQMVSLCLARAGFSAIETGEVLPGHGDPIWAVIARAGGS